MGTRRAQRIDAAEAERLLAGQSTGAARAGLAALLSEAAAPPRPEELADEAAAVAALRMVRSAPPSTVELSTPDGPGHRRWYGRWPARTAALRVALVVLLLVAVGTVTVKLGYRPARMQSPGNVSSSTPSPSPSPSSPEAGRGHNGHPSGSAPPGGAPGTAMSTTSPTADMAEAVQLCRVWTDAKQDRATRDQAAERLKRLMDAVYGPNGVPAFCRKVLDEPPASAPPDAKATGTATTEAGKATTTRADLPADAATGTADAKTGAVTPTTAAAKTAKPTKKDD
jgi:hypothetical protein